MPTDNTVLPGVGVPIRDEDVGGGVHLPVTKIYLGAANVDGGPVTTANPMPVNVVAGGITFVLPNPLPVTMTAGNITLSQAGVWSTNLSQVGGAPIALGQTTRTGAICMTVASDEPAHPMNVVPSGTAAGWTPFPAIIAANGLNVTQIKAAPGQLGALEVFNTSASMLWIKIYDSLTTPVVGTDTPKKTIGVPSAAGGGGYTHEWVKGVKFTLGIWIATTGLKDKADVTPVLAGDLAINLDYA